MEWAERTGDRRLTEDNKREQEAELYSGGVSGTTGTRSGRTRDPRCASLHSTALHRSTQAGPSSTDADRAIRRPSDA